MTDGLLSTDSLRFHYLVIFTPHDVTADKVQNVGLHIIQKTNYDVSTSFFIILT